MHPLLSCTQVYASALFMLQSSRTCITGAFKFTHFLHSHPQAHAPAFLAHSSSRTRFIHTFKLTHPHRLRIRVHVLASFFTGTFKPTHRSTRALKSCLHIIRGILARSPHVLHTHACSSLTRASHICMFITHTRLTHMHAHYSSRALMHSTHALARSSWARSSPALACSSQAFITCIHPSPTHSAHSRVTVHSSRGNHAPHDATHHSASHTAAFTLHITQKQAHSFIIQHIRMSSHRSEFLSLIFSTCT